MREFTSHIGDKYDKSLEEIREKMATEAPEQYKFVTCYIYKGGKFLDKFKLSEYERYIKKYVDNDKYPHKAILRDKFAQAVQASGFTFGWEIDRKKLDPVLAKFNSKTNTENKKLIDGFKEDLFGHYEVNDLAETEKERIYNVCVEMAQDGGFHFTEKSFVRVLDLMGVKEDPNPEILPTEGEKKALETKKEKK